MSIDPAARVGEFTEAGAFVLAFGREVNASKVALRKAEESAKEPVTVTSQEEDICTGTPGSECQAGTPGSGEAAFEFAGRGTPIAIDSITGEVYVGSRGRLLEFGGGSQYLRAATVAVVSIQPEATTVKAKIDPENAETEYFVEYGTGTQLPLGNRTTVGKLAPSFEDSEVSVTLTGLSFSAEYHYCLIAVNAKGQTPCEQKTFVSSPATAIASERTSDITDTSATLEAEINPEGSATECWFEYGPAGGGGQVATASVDIGAGTSDVRVAAHVSGLSAHTVYFYRVVAHNQAR